MIGDIIKVIYLSRNGGENKAELLRLISSILRGAFIRVTIMLSITLVYLFLLGFTHVFGESYLFIKVIFFVFLFAGIVASGLLFLMYKIVKYLGRSNEQNTRIQE